MIKKLLYLLLVVVLAVSVFSACDTVTPGTSKSEESSQESKVPDPTDEVTPEPVTIRILGSAGWAEDVTDAVEQKCNEQGVFLEKEFYDWSTYDGKQKIAMTSKGGDYDVVMLPGSYLNTWAQAEALIPVDDFLSEYGYDLNDYYGSVKKFSSSGDKFYMVPFSAEAMIFYYRKDIFEAEGVEPPETIEEMYQLGKQLTKDGMYGVAYPGGPEEGSSSFWSYFLWSYGGTYFDADWKPQVNTTAAVDAAIMFAKILKECAPQGVSTWQNEETVAAFNAGNLASMIMWPGFWGTVTDKESSKVWDKVAVAPVPVGPSGKAVPRFGAWGLGITASSEKVDAAGIYVNAFTDQDAMKLIAKYTCTASKAANSIKELQDGNPTLAGSAGALDFADERPPIPEAQQYISVTGNAINSIVAGKDAKTTLDEANQAVYKIMEDAGYYD